VAIGKDDAEVGRRAEAIGQDVEQLASGGLAGTPEQAAHILGGYAELGVTRAYLQVLDLQDLEHLDLIAGSWRHGLA